MNTLARSCCFLFIFLVPGCPSETCVQEEEVCSLLQRSPPVAKLSQRVLKHSQASLRENDEDDRLEAWDKNSPSFIFWSNPVVLGLILGLVLIGPDHLGTLMALSTLTSGYESFKVGFSWGFGHSLGMILVCPLFFLVRDGAKRLHISMERWEYFGDYFIGASMICVASYFVIYESRYIEKQEDGTYKALGCSCNCDDASCNDGKASTAEGAAAQQPDKFCGAYGKSAPKPRAKKVRSFAKEVPSLEGPSSEQQQLPASSEGDSSDCGEDKHDHSACMSGRSLQSLAIGSIQGLCCPMGIAGMGFLAHMSIIASPTKLTIFAVTMVLASSIGSGAIAYGWGALTTHGAGGWMSARAIYRASCLLTFVLGVGWVLANATGVLDSINFAESMVHQKMMPLQNMQTL